MKGPFFENMQNFNKITLIGPMLENSLNVDLNHPHIFVDGGTNFLPPEKFIKTLHFRVGDGDSWPRELDITLPANKDYSDLDYALGLIPEHIEEIELKGFLGGRKSHEFANFGEVHKFLKGRTQTKVLWDEGITSFSEGNYQLSANGEFSILTIENTEIKVLGECEYKLPDFKELAPLSSMGLSNVGNGDIQIEARGPFILLLEEQDRI